MKWTSKQFSIFPALLLAVPVSFVFAQGMGSSGSLVGEKIFKPTHSQPKSEIMRTDPPPTDPVQGGKIMEAPTNIEKTDSGMSGGKDILEVSSSSQMKRILLVDDHAMARKALQLYLENLGYVCEEVEHGAAALAYLEKSPGVDLLISDNRMPVMTGMELLLQVKTRPQFKSLPMIMYSGNLTKELSKKALELGAIAVLDKPYNFSELEAVITKALETPKSLETLPPN